MIEIILKNLGKFELGWNILKRARETKEKFSVSTLLCWMSQYSGRLLCVYDVGNV